MSDTPAHIIIAGSAVTMVIALVVAGIVAGRSMVRKADRRELRAAKARAEHYEELARYLDGAVGSWLSPEDRARVDSALRGPARGAPTQGKHAAGSDPR